MNESLRKRISPVSLILFIITGIIILAQILFLGTNACNIPNVYKGVMGATKIYENGEISLMPPMMILWGLVSKLFRVHPLIVIFSVSPFVMLPLYYFVYFRLSAVLFNESLESRAVFMLTATLLNTFAYQSDVAAPYMLLTGWYRDECVLVNIILPAALIFLIKYLDRKGITDAEYKCDISCSDDEEIDEWEDEMKKHPVMNSRNVGIALIVCMILVFGAIFVLNRKINNLHNATQNLQKGMNEELSLYEFVPGESGEVKGYLMKLTDGRLVMIGGGEEEDGEALYDFITKYGDNVDTWYLYKSDKTEDGAYKFCCDEKGIKTENVKYITVENE